MIFFICSLLFSDPVNGYLIEPDPLVYPSEQYCGSDNLTFYNHTPFSYLIEEPNLCFGDVFLVTYVQTSSYNFDKRMVIRETFASLRFIGNEAVRLLFVIGRPHDPQTEILIEKESREYRDIVQANFKDTYFNLTLKHIVSLDWIRRFCSHAKFISKTDDDTFISIFQLVTYLKEKFDWNQRFIFGQISSNEVPIRESKIKWYVSNETYQGDKYPPFTKGFAYVMSQAAIKPLFICSYYVKFLFIDDIFITGLVAPMANVSLVDFERFYGHMWIAHHNITIDMMENLFIVSQTEYHPDKWRELWKMVLRTEL